MTKYRGRGSRYRGRGQYRRGNYSPYSSRKYGSYSASRPNLSSYSRSSQNYSSEPKYDSRSISQLRTQDNSESRYLPRSENQTYQGSEKNRRLLSREEFFEHYPTDFPKHWNDDFRKEVMDMMYRRYIDFEGPKPLKDPIEKETLKAEPEAEKKDSNEKVGNKGTDFETNPQDRLLDEIKEKGAESSEGKAAYEELMETQLKEINDLEDEYWKQKDKEPSPQEVEIQSNDGKEVMQESSSDVEIEELDQPEVENIMEQMEGEIFEPEGVESYLELDDIQEGNQFAESAPEIMDVDMEQLDGEISSELSGIEDEAGEEAEGFEADSSV